MSASVTTRKTRARGAGLRREGVGFDAGYPPAGGGSSCHSTSSRSLPCFRFQKVTAAPIAARIAVNFRSFRKKPFFFFPVPSLSSPKGTLLIVGLDGLGPSALTFADIRRVAATRSIREGPAQKVLGPSKRSLDRRWSKHEAVAQPHAPLPVETNGSGQPYGRASPRPYRMRRIVAGEGCRSWSSRFTFAFPPCTRAMLKA